ncbi:hypothetical protein ACFV7R_14225 [Streptomyces sp. NPDC059866]|uniref:hypothetical protein n=1 Tax=Streptomyces sp. NPDC059866 TaxID=3346978 RepID=UPI0036489E53
MNTEKVDHPQLRGFQNVHRLEGDWGVIDVASAPPVVRLAVAGQEPPVSGTTFGGFGGSVSEYHYVFVLPGSPRERLVGDISVACGAALGPVDSEFVDYAANLGYAAVEVELSHEYEEDHGIPFDRYDSLLTVRDFDSDLDRQEATARRIFDNLSAVGRYELILVRDLQRLLASSGPGP